MQNYYKKIRNKSSDWFFSVRHHLGAVQIEAAKNPNALQTLEEDLEVFPKNGWALHGLERAYSELNNVQKASEISERLTEAWATAGIKLNNARLK